MTCTVLESFPPPALESAWRACLAHGDFATHYAAPEYFHEPYFKEPFAVLALEGDAVTGIITGVIRNGIAECGIPGRPQICLRREADPDRTVQSFAGGLREHARGRAGLIKLSTWKPLPFPYRVRLLENDLANVLIDLKETPDTLFAKFSATQRNQAKYALKHGVTARALTEEDFPDYYALYCDWSLAKGLSAQPEVTQREALRSPNRVAFGAYHDGKLLATSTFRFYPGGVIEYAANNSRREESRFRPNDLLMWTAIQWACAHGLHTLSMGGAHFFLRRFGGTVVPSYEYRKDLTLLLRHDSRDRVARLARTALRVFFPNRARRSARGSAGRQ
jgi:hypothetical protein